MTNVSVTLHWTEPRQPNGLIAGYRLYYMSKQVTDVVTVKDKAKEIVYQLKNIGIIKITYFGIIAWSVHTELSVSLNLRILYTIHFRALHQVLSLGESLHVEARGQLLRHNRGLDGCVWPGQVRSAGADGIIYSTTEFPADISTNKLSEVTWNIKNFVNDKIFQFKNRHKECGLRK